ncbi:MAG: DUF2007 domain-containing protein [Candidatus Thiodiazotropha taylori]|nr:DUF2007 domain-containing protein [Candidatus Thiodiazotropha taylori]
MKLLLSTRHIDEAERAKILLESKGIPAFISNKYQNNVRRYFPKLLGVWVYLNEQETEALKVLENPEYEVMEPIDTNEFYRQLPEKEVGALARAQLLKWLFASLISVVLIAGILGVLIKN